MMKLSKRVWVSLLLLVSLCITLLTFTSCDRSFDKEEIEQKAKELLQKCEVLNTVYYGGGIRYITGYHQDGVYYQADDFHLAALGFSTVKELRDLTYSVFTDAMCESIFSSKLSGTSSDLGIVELARYYQLYEYDKNFNPVDEICIMVNSSMQKAFDDLMTYDYTSIKATHSEGETVFVNVDIVVKNDDGDIQERTLTLSLVEESDGWRFNCITFANYVEGFDKYEDLTNK